MAAPFMNSSSFIWTSSPNTVTPSILSHFPIEEFHPMIVLFTQLYYLTLDPLSITTFYNLTPSSTRQSSPMHTFGPIIAFGEILADLSNKTFPIIFGPLDNKSGLVYLYCSRIIYVPIR